MQISTINPTLKRKGRTAIPLIPAALFLTGTLMLAPTVARSAPGVIHVSGNHLADHRGRFVRLQGVNIPSMEWSNDGDQVSTSIDTAVEDWHARIIRLPLCQDRWFGEMDTPKGSPFVALDIANPNASAARYRANVDKVVRQTSDHNCYVLLDLHWSDGGQWGQNVGQHVMPDDNSILFWKDIAARYANNPAVLFDLYNEPHDVSWDVWQHGGDIDEHNDDPSRGLHLQYHSPGMQAMLDAVRSTGAKNVVVAGGTDWAYDLSGLLNGHALTDATGRGVVYATHIYPWNKDWDAHVTPATAKFAVYVGEVGCSPAKQSDPNWQQVDTSVWAPAVLAYINKHKLNWTAWSFHPGASPCLIAAWTYEPTKYWGAYVKADLTGQPASPAPVAAPAP